MHFRSFSAAGLAFLAWGCGATDRTAPPVPASIQLSSTGTTSVQAGQSLQLTATVTDNRGVIMAGQTVVFTVEPTSAGTVSSSGLFTSTGKVGIATVRATSSGFAATLPITVTPGPASVLTKVAGDNQSKTVGQFADTLSVKVTDSFGNPVPTTSVQWTVSAASASLSSPTSVTGSDGIAKIRVAVGEVALPFSVGAAAGGTSVSYAITAVAGPASRLVKISGDNQLGVAAAISDTMTVAVTDQFGNPISGFTVDWTITLNALVVFSSTVTDALGRAKNLAFMPSKVGVATMSAVALGTSVSFTLTSRAGPPAALTIYAGPNQSTLPGTAFANPLVVIPYDAHGNPVTNATISWSIESGSATLSSTATSTNSAGQGSVTVTAGAVPGAVVVRAQTGALVVRFNLTVMGP